MTSNSGITLYQFFYYIFFLLVFYSFYAICDQLQSLLVNLVSLYYALNTNLYHLQLLYFIVNTKKAVALRYFSTA